jgi:hypothetical protein
MKKHSVPVMLLCSVALLLVSSLSFAADKPMKGTMAKGPQNHYLIMMTHTPEECLKALDEFSTQGKSLGTFEFGCKSGDHTAYAIVAAANEDAARNTCPTSMRANAKIIAVNKFTPAEIKKLHETMAGH